MVHPFIKLTILPDDNDEDMFSKRPIYIKVDTILQVYENYDHETQIITSPGEETCIADPIEPILVQESVEEVMSIIQMHYSLMK